jgi:hypothetical protein
VAHCYRVMALEFGGVKLRDTAAAALVQSKAVHVVLIVPTVLANVCSGSPNLALPLGETVPRVLAGRRRGGGRRAGRRGG